MSKSFLTRSCLASAIAMAAASVAYADDDPRSFYPQIETTTSLGINMQNGRFTERGTEFTIGPFNVDHRVSFTAGPAGGVPRPKSIATSIHGWTVRTTAGSETKQHVQLGELTLTFNVNTVNGTFFPFDSANTGWKMVASGSDYVLTNKSGETYVFNTHAALPSTSRVLTYRTSGDGHRLDYTYDSSGILHDVKSNRGYAIVFQYTSNSTTVCGYNLAVTQVTSSTTCTSAPIKAVYGFNGSGQISTITNPLNDVVTLNYTSGKLTCVTLPNSSTCAVTNVYADGTHPTIKADFVMQQTTADGTVYYQNYSPAEPISVDNPTYYGEIRYAESWVGSPAGGGGGYARFANGYIDTYSTPEKGWMTFEQSSLEAYSITTSNGTSGPYYYSVYPSRVTHPQGNSTYYTRNYADVLTSVTEFPKPGSGASSKTMFWNYPTAYKWSNPTICATSNVLCDKPTKFTDFAGNETDFVYSSTHGGLLKKTLPADSGGIRAQTRYTYAQKYAWYKSGGSWVQASTPVWVLVSEEFCKTSAADGSGNCAAGASDEVVTTYEYEAGSSSKGSNIRLLGTAVTANGTTLRTCVQYDELGRKIAETQPKAGLSSCQ